MIIYYY